MGLRLVGDKELGGRLRSAREWAGVKGRELSRTIGQYEEFVSKLETGRVQSIGIETLKLIAAALAGRGRLRDVDEGTLVQFLQGEIGMDDAIRPIQAPATAPRGADFDKPLTVGERLDKEEAPAETGTSKTPSPARAGSHDQMSYSVLVTFPRPGVISRSLRPRRAGRGSSSPFGDRRCKVAKSRASWDNSLPRSRGELSPRATPCGL